jgi:hypothetical protein
VARIPAWQRLGGAVPAGGSRVCDVWESEEIFQRLAEGRIGPITEEVGLPRPEVRSFAVAQIRSGGDDPVEFVQVVSIPGTTADDFHALDEKVLGPGGEVPAACVYHVNGALGDGYAVLDYWSSKAGRDEFVQTKVGPQSRPRESPPSRGSRELVAHNSLTARV